MMVGWLVVMVSSYLVVVEIDCAGRVVARTEVGAGTTRAPEQVRAGRCAATRWATARDRKRRTDPDGHLRTQCPEPAGTTITYMLEAQALSNVDEVIHGSGGSGGA
jgi:hypothetical protein